MCWRSAITSETETAELTLGQAAARYLGGLPAGERELATSEINTFVKILGHSTPLSQITRTQVDRYQERATAGRGDSSSRIEPVKAFLADLKSRKLTQTNLGAVLRLKRRATAGGAARAEAQVVELTQEGHDQLKAELDRLESERVPQLREALALARQDGDFRENAPYDEAKREMAEVQSKIERIKGQLKSGRIVAREQGGHRAGLGSKVVLRDVEDEVEDVYTLVGPGEVRTRENRISIHSPIGLAVRDRAVGETVRVDLPVGTRTFRIQRIEQGD